MWAQSLEHTDVRHNRGMRFQKGIPYAHPKRGRVSLPKTCIGCWIRMEKHAELALALDSHGTSLEVAVLPEVEERHGFWESVGREDVGCLIRRRFGFLVIAKKTSVSSGTSSKIWLCTPISGLSPSLAFPDLKGSW